MRPYLVVALFLAVSLAGCASGPGDKTVVGGQTGVDSSYQLAADRGAISGLVIDDRFRPVEAATVILWPSGFVATSDGSGQFSFVDIKPGAYELQAGKDGHEAAPERAEVVPGDWTEETIMARRTSGEADLPDRVVYQFTLWETCRLNGVVISGPCNIQTGEGSGRYDYAIDFTNYEDAAELVAEYRFSQEAQNRIRISEADICGGRYCDYYQHQIYNEYYGDYAKEVLPLLPRGDQSRYSDVGSWDNLYPVWVHYTPFGGVADSEAIRDFVGVPSFFGAGVRVAPYVDVAITVFIGDHGIDTEAYCILCD